jgi:hypothetical protein
MSCIHTEVQADPEREAVAGNNSGVVHESKAALKDLEVLAMTAAARVVLAAKARVGQGPGTAGRAEEVGTRVAPEVEAETALAAEGEADRRVSTRSWPTR